MGRITLEKDLSAILNFEDARHAARLTLPRSLFQYIDGLADAGVTGRRNLQAFSDVEFQPRMGDWVGLPRLDTTVLGRKIAFPVLTAPCGGMRVVHPGGDRAIAAAAARAGSVHIASCASGYTLEEIAAVDGPQWFQLYRMAGRAMLESLVHRAASAGYEAVVVTIDTAVNGNRELDVRNGFSLARSIGLRSAVGMAPQLAVRPGWTARFLAAGMPLGLANTAQLSANGRPAPLSEMTRNESLSPTWEDIAWVRHAWKGPLVIKGLLTVDDAKRAVDAGAQAIIVSNHGGRQLDGSPASLTALARIAEAIGDRIELLLDSGIRSGSDVVKACAYGARAVLVGRLAAWGLAIGGENGVAHMLDILRAGMIRTLRLLGCADVNRLDRSWVSA